MGAKSPKSPLLGGGNKNNNNNNSNTQNNNTMDIYNTVWLSDYESVKSFGSQSGISSLNQSKMLESFVNDVCHSSPKTSAGEFLQQTGWCRTCARKYSPKYYLRRTLSLPELDMSTLRPTDLQDRFSQLQLEQENSELRLLVDQLQNALETIEKSMNHNLKIDMPGPGRKGSKQGSSVSKQTNVEGEKGVNQSMDSLDEMYAHAMNETNNTRDNTGSKRDESGYNSTFNQDTSSGHIQDEKEFSRQKYSKKDRYSDYSDGSGSDSEEFYESRLSKKQRFEGDESNCCVIH